MVLCDRTVGSTVLVGVRNLTSAEAKKIARYWIDHTIKNIGEDFISFDENAYDLDRQCIENPTFALEIIICIIKMYEENDVFDPSKKGSNTDIVLSNLAAGPLEDLLSYHGAEIISSLEAEAQVDNRIRWILGRVWRNDISQDVWDRIRRVAIVQS